MIDTLLVSFTKFYGIDWLAFSCLLAAYILIGQKNKWGFLVQLVGHISWLYVGFVAEIPAMLVANVFFGGIMMYNFWKWHTKK